MTVAQRSSADRMIASRGQAVIVTRMTAGAYNPATSSSSVTESTQTGKGVILPLRPERKMAGVNIVAGDQQLLLSALKSDGSVLAIPHVDDMVTLVNGTDLHIVAVEPLTPAGLDIIYDCIVRRIPAL